MAAGEAEVGAAPALKVVGTRLARVDARERVTGEARYPADLALPGMVHAKMLRSPHAHARIRRIDTRARQALKGVLAVVTAADFPELPVGAMIPMGETGYDMWMVARSTWRAARCIGSGSRWRRWRRSTCTWPRRRWR